MTKSIQIETATYTYTWKPSDRFCDLDAHQLNGSCEDCCDGDECADCGHAINGGELFLICTDNGEVIHASADDDGVIHAECSPAAASADWVDYY